LVEEHNLSQKDLEEIARLRSPEGKPCTTHLPGTTW
jgi:hypothetical protein